MVRPFGIHLKGHRSRTLSLPMEMMPNALPTISRIVRQSQHMQFKGISVMSLYVEHRELMKATRKVIGKRIKDD